MRDMFYSHEPLVAIDIGTTKISVLVGQIKSANTLEIIGVGKSASHGLSKGIVVDIEKTIHSIKQAIADAQLMSGCKIESAYIGISGSHVQSLNSQGVVPLKKGVVTPREIDQVIKAAQTIPLDEGQSILHVLPQFFIIDSHERVANPLDMHGVRLETQVHIITGSATSVQNLVTCCQKAGIAVKDIVLEQLASAQAVLTDDERQLGVGMLDIGGGTSDFALYKNNSIMYTMVLPVAGNHFTNDCALGVRTSLQQAEHLKRKFGRLMLCIQEKDVLIPVQEIHADEYRHVSLEQLTSILKPRARELFTLINQALIQDQVKNYMHAGLVLTGGGSMLADMDDLAELIFEVPVRLGVPRMKGSVLEALDNPIYATGYGLILHALQQRKKREQAYYTASMMHAIKGRMKSWISDFF